MISTSLIVISLLLPFILLSPIDAQMWNLKCYEHVFYLHHHILWSLFQLLFPCQGLQFCCIQAVGPSKREPPGILVQLKKEYVSMLVKILNQDVWSPTCFSQIESTTRQRSSSVVSVKCIFVPGTFFFFFYCNNCYTLW